MADRRDTHDSYTGEPYVEEYTSQIEGIRQGRSPFYKTRELQKISEQYLVSPAGEGWQLWRRGCPKNIFPQFDSQAAAVMAMDWCVANDGSVGVALHWLNQKNLEPFFNLLDHIMAAARGERNAAA
jgi:hypothetical protein